MRHRNSCQRRLRCHSAATADLSDLSGLCLLIDAAASTAHVAFTLDDGVDVVLSLMLPEGTDRPHLSSRTADIVEAVFVALGVKPEPTSRVGHSPDDAALVRERVGADFPRRPSPDDVA
jgi:hypothetical protein